MSREDTKNQEKTNIKPDETADQGLGLSNTEANHQLAQLGSPFAHIPTSADLIDLWDETDRFFDSLGDPNEFIEPEGNPTYKLNDQDLDYLKVAASTSSDSPPDTRPNAKADSEFVKPKVKFFDQEVAQEDLENPADINAEHNENQDVVVTEEIGKIEAEKLDYQKAHQQINLLSITNETQDHQVKFKLKKDTSAKNNINESIRPSLSERFIRRHEARPSPTCLVVVAGGKGGVGRSLLCANLAFALSHLSSSDVGVVDLDPIHGSLHTYLGLEPQIELPGKALRGGIQPSCERVPKTKVILTRVARPLCEPLSEESRHKALEAALSLKLNWLIVDAGGYSDPFTLDLFVNADQSLIMYSPDPNGLEAGHLFLQSALYRQLVNRGDEASSLARSLLNADHEGLLTGPTALARSLRHIHPKACQQLESSISNFKPRIIVNNCRTQTDRITADEICSVLKRKWRIQPEVWGTISYHHIALQSLVDRRPLAKAFPSAPIYLDIDRIARQVVKEASSKRKSALTSSVAALSTSDQ